MSTKTVAAVVKEGNCMGCGTCEAACPTGAVRIELDSGRGVYNPTVAEQACTDCGICMAVCPGREVYIDALADQFIEAPNENQKLGRFRRLMLGYARNDRVRYDGASGGLVTALLVHALEKRLIDGALVLGHEGDRPLITRPYIARSREEIIAANGSKYCPAAVNRALRDILEQRGKYGVVGLPCQVHALRKWQARDPLMRERVKYVLGLFCVNTSTYLGTEYFLWCHGISHRAVRSIRYRAQGWPGEIEVRMKDETRRFARGTTETDPIRLALLASAFHFDFMLPRCMVCCDQSCELADASFADPHLEEMRRQYSNGISWAVVRNPAMENLIESALTEGHIHMEPFAEDLAFRAQNYSHKANVGGRMAYWDGVGFRVPDYGRSFQATRKQRRRARRYWWSLHSHRRWLWPILRMLCTRQSLLPNPLRLFPGL